VDVYDADYSIYFGHCILIYRQLALCVNAKQPKRAQVEMLYENSIFYDFYVVVDSMNANFIT
jgi:hypothetical protein